MTEQRIGPDGMFINPYGTTFSERDRLAVERKRASEVTAAVAEREAVEAAAQAERVRQRKEDGQRRLEQYRQQCATRWQDNGGTEAGFASAWPALRDTWLADQLSNQEKVTVEEVARLRQHPAYQV